MKNMAVIIFFLLALLSSTSYSASYNSEEANFCVADLKAPRTPSGYNCKADEKVTIDDFVYSRFKVVDTDKRYKYGFTQVTVRELPALNGIQLGVANIELDVNGVIPMHSHQHASEVILMIEGQITATFVIDKQAFTQTLEKGKVMLIPKGLLHYVLNSGKGKATFYSVFDNSNPGFQILSNNLFGNDIPAVKISQTTGISVEEVKKLKEQFGGNKDR